MKRILVTGAAGRLGRATIALLATNGVETVGLDLVTAQDTGAGRFVTGPVDDPEAVRDAIGGCDAVIHLAAIPAPTLGTPEEVFGRNSLATFTVLNTAGRAGIGRAVIASSQSIFGLAFAPVPLAPAYLPLDDALPLQVADPYALSKQADEATGAMAARRYGMTVVALRYPLLGSADRLPTIAERYRDDPASGARSFWAYLDHRDAARAAWLGLHRPLVGYHMFHVAAPETLAARPTDELLDRFYPGVPRHRPLLGQTVPIDLGPAEGLLGFRSEHHHTWR